MTSTVGLEVSTDTFTATGKVDFQVERLLSHKLHILSKLPLKMIEPKESVEIQGISSTSSTSFPWRIESNKRDSNCLSCELTSLRIEADDLSVELFDCISGEVDSRSVLPFPGRKNCPNRNMMNDRVDGASVFFDEQVPHLFHVKGRMGVSE